MDFKKALVKTTAKNTKSISKKRTLIVKGEYPDFKVKLNNGKLVDIDKDSIRITDDVVVLYSTPENDYYANWTRTNLNGTKRLTTEIVSNFWSTIKPNIKVEGNINDRGTFTVTKINHL